LESTPEKSKQDVNNIKKKIPLTGRKKALETRSGEGKDGRGREKDINGGTSSNEGVRNLLGRPGP